MGKNKTVKELTIVEKVSLFLITITMIFAGYVTINDIKIKKVKELILFLIK